MNDKIKNTTLCFNGEKIPGTLNLISIIFFFFLTSLSASAQRHNVVATYYLKNETIAAGNSVVYRADREISSAEANQFVVSRGGYVMLKAGKIIKLGPGCKIEGNFSGTIETPDDASADEQFFLKDDESEVSVFPNPSSDVVNISAPYSICSVSVIDMNGQLMMREENINNETFIMDISSLEKGFYIFEIVSPKNNIEKIRLEKK